MTPGHLLLVILDDLLKSSGGISLPAAEGRIDSDALLGDDIHLRGLCGAHLAALNDCVPDYHIIELFQIGGWAVSHWLSWACGQSHPSGSLHF